jgi:hypothetical protein
MAGVYEIKLVSHWVNFNPQDLEEIIEKAIKKEQEKNEVEVHVTQVG